MIKFITGAKGTGKTKIIIDMANDNVATAKGDIVFVTDTDRYMPNLRNQMKKINTKDEEVFSEAELIGFIKGIIACNYDITTFFIDGAHRICGKDVSEMEKFYQWICEKGVKSNIEFFVTASKDLDEMPDFLKKYI